MLLKYINYVNDFNDFNDCERTNTFVIHCIVYVCEYLFSLRGNIF